MNTRLLADRVALITGAGRGIGRAMALGFARQGAAIVATARTESELTSLVEEISRLDSRSTAIVGDLADPATPLQIVQQAEQSFGTVDILVNNAGIGSSAGPRPVVDFDDKLWHLTLALNLTAPYLLCKAVLPIFIKRQRGRIINIASVFGKTGHAHGVAYSASKHGLLGLTRTLALEVAGQGISVNAICPGPVRSLMSDKRVDYDAKRLGISPSELESRLNPIGRRLEPEEMVPIAVLLASDGAAAITGQAFNVCGGLAMF